MNKFFKKERKKILGAAIVLVFLIAAGSFFYLSRQKTQDDMAPPIIKEIMVLNDDVKKTMIEIYKAMEKLDGLGMVQSRQTDIESGIEAIADLRNLAEKNQNAIDRLIRFMEDHSDFLQRKNLFWVFAINEFYKDPSILAHRQIQADYFSAFETLLQYTGKNFANINEVKSKPHMANYDAYYARYRKAADNYNRVNKKRIEFQKDFMEAHPEVKSFLPGAHQSGAFRFWDKFSL